MLCFGAVFGGLADVIGSAFTDVAGSFPIQCYASAAVYGSTFANVAGSFPSSCYAVLQQPSTVQSSRIDAMLCFASASSSAVWRSSSARPSRVDAMLCLVVRRPSSFRPSQVDAMLRFGAVFGSRHLFSVPELMLCGTERISIPFTKRKEYQNETNIGTNGTLNHTFVTPYLTPN